MGAYKKEKLKVYEDCQAFPEPAFRDIIYMLNKIMLMILYSQQINAGCTISSLMSTHKWFDVPESY